MDRRTGWLKAIKKGDTVLVRDVGGMGPKFVKYVKAIVKRITPSGMINTTRGQFTASGSRVGGNRYMRSHLVEATPERLEEVAHQRPRSNRIAGSVAEQFPVICAFCRSQLEKQR